MTFSRLTQMINWFMLMGFMAIPGLARAEDLFADQTLRTGFYALAFPDLSYEDLEITVKLLTEEIGEKVGIKSTVTVFNDIALMRNAFDKGEINFVAASSLNLANDFDNNLLTDGFKFVPSTEPDENLIVLTRKNEGLDHFKVLHGKRLALVEHNPMADLYLDFLALSNFKIGYEASFREVLREKKAHQIILKLFFGQADVICTYQHSYDLATELNPQLLSKLQIISQLNGIPQGSGLFHKKVPAAFRERVITEALKLGDGERGQQLIHIFKAEKVVRASLADLTRTKQFYSDYQQLKKTK
jgi:ABC-type phosphate/phosphonate transport system substrate-binding protein